MSTDRHFLVSIFPMVGAILLPFRGLVKKINHCCQRGRPPNVPGIEGSGSGNVSSISIMTHQVAFRLSRTFGGGLKPELGKGNLYDAALSRARSSGWGISRRKKRSAEYP